MTERSAAPVDNPHRDLWYTMFGVGHPELKRYQRFNMRLPSPPRCKLCYAPYRGLGSVLMKLQGREPSNKNPRYCSRCDQFLRQFPGGAEVGMTIVFLDVRGSSRMGKAWSAMEFSRAMQSFYGYTFPILNETDGFIVDVRSDGVLAVYPPGFAGQDHAQKAMRAVTQLLSVPLPAPDGSHIQFGIGAHTGTAYVGTMTGAQAGVEDVAVLGDAANVAAHLCSAARAGEALVSDSTWSAAQGDTDDCERRGVALKGSNTPMRAYVVRGRVTTHA